MVIENESTQTASLRRETISDDIERVEDIQSAHDAGKAVSEPARRRFFRQVGVTSLGISAAMLGSPALAFGDEHGLRRERVQRFGNDVGRLNLAERREAAFQVRARAARFHFTQPMTRPKINGDEYRYENKIASYSKALPHNTNGEVDLAAYTALEKALRSGVREDFASVPLGGTLKLLNPRDAYAFSIEGRDTQDYQIRPAPRFDSAERAGEMAELYWQALTRDVNFADYDNHTLINAAAKDLSAFSDFRGLKSEGRVTPETLFRGTTVGDGIGPYLSQFLWQNVPYGVIPVQQRIRTGAAGVDYMKSYAQWLAVQNGTVMEQLQLDTVPRFIRNGRDLAAYVGRDFPYQSSLSAALILLAMKVPTNEAIPYPSETEAPFGILGPHHIFDLLGSAVRLGVLATQYQKWLLHNNLRPEAFGGRVHNHISGNAQYPIHQDLFDSNVTERVYATQGTYLLPQAYPEGSPTNPSYPAGHAVLAAAGATILKAFFMEDWVIQQPVQANADGTALVPYEGDALTVGNELNKLTSNIAIGRNTAGVHYRTDARDGILLGEAVAISVLRDYRFTLTEEFPGFEFTSFDGRRIHV